MSEDFKFLIGQLSRETGLSRDTLRFYEKEGILRSERLENNYRVYSSDDIDRLRFVEQAQSAGFHIREIREIMKKASAGEKRCSDYDNVAREKMKDLDNKIAALQKARQVLQQSLTCCDLEHDECNLVAGL